MHFTVSLLSNPAILLAIVSLIGLIAQHKKTTDVLKGTFRTAIGFLIFGVGASTMTASLQNFNAMFQKGFHLTGVIASPEAATALAQGRYGFVVSVTLIAGFIMNLVFARITPFKNVFFTGGHSLFFACVLALVLKAHGIGNTMAIIVGGTILGFVSAALPQLCQPFMRKITGGDFQAIAHFNMIGYALSGFIGNVFKSHKDETTENIKFPEWLSFFKDFLMGVAVVMIIIFYVAAIAAGKIAVTKLSGTTDWLVFPMIQALTFTAGISILMTGVRMFLAEITAAFVAISEKFIPGSRPALDVPTIFPFAPTAVLVGFLSSYTAGLLAIVVMVMLKFPIVIIPAAHICFFSGGTAGIFGNSTGGWRGAILGSFIVGLLLAFLPLLLYPTFSSLGITGSTFPNVDYNIVGSLLNWFLGIFH
ncbi:PTS ascorbate transporter subunit IIC [Companilactobacillus bobalius]|uniref:Ascorbate-specific PTS system EIIC component n=2 Tax=Companilactobacillus bobalius TaxID=2801451 RepID=A0A202FAZ6_9LACO|nr:PTS ascorbate transporter subunit IIC [Companilactobacillus bobalius]KAE9562580.1 PTS beta-glucoside transporter subunit IIBC [Companilactobacillus bobalius]KRK81577.1 ascorbate-specific PTS system enzyme IIC [Companilactobacillus bobalius DSM 19674]OVE97649.1 Ascorbate-specific permease IIC component UlaA [Companilactobacillus bobalius]GEO57738.1 PTS ascorbate transporter subunit IIC [Companilactobacillus paralimentarius]